MPKFISIPLILLILVLSQNSYFLHPANAQDGSISSVSFNDHFDVDDEFDINEEPAVISDPFEKYNRWMFHINQRIYKSFFNPLSRGYDFLIPKFIQKRINNVSKFSRTPTRLFNNILQIKIKSAFVELERFLINGSVGIAGLFDPAQKWFNLQQQTEDFGQTLGHYGVKSGPYIIWPIIGPSNAREVIGLVGDYALSPFTWFAVYDIESQDAFNAFTITSRVNNYSYNVRDTYTRITTGTIDDYIALQSIFYQNRNMRIKE